MTTKTSILINYFNELPIIEEHGIISGVLVEYDFGKMLFVVDKASILDFKNRIIEWDVVCYIWKPSDQIWEKTNSNLFSTNSSGNNRMLIDDTTKVDLNGLPNENGLISEIDFYIEGLGKKIIYPGIQEALKRKII